MQKRIEDILDTAVARIRNGEEISTVVSSYPAELREQLAANLNLAKLGLSLSKKAVPSPTRRKLYLQAKPQSTLSRIAELFNIYTLSLASLALVLVSVSYVAANSVPGDRLFSLKRSVEIARLRLATNPEDQARLQLTFANARLAEAEQVLADKNYSQTDAAISALNTQTEDAINNIQQIAAQNPKAIKDQSLISSVKSLADSQTQLVNKVNKDQPASPQIAASTLKTVENIQKLIAASNDQTTVTLPANAAIDTTGTITAVDDVSITVDKNVYVVDPATTRIVDQVGNNVKFEDLAVGDNIKVEGHVKDDSNLAETITVISKAPAATTTAPTSTDSTKTDKTAPTDQSVAPAPASSTDSSANTDPTADPKPQDTFGGFILEAPGSN